MSWADELSIGFQARAATDRLVQAIKLDIKVVL
jgi:hypothetical protein